MATHEGLFAWLVLLILPEECYVEFFEKFNFLDVPCLKIAVSKGLGYGIILGSVMVKLPQIIKILMSKSGEGISIIGVTFELIAISTTWAYSVANSFPFSAWGEAFFLAIQTSAIAFLCLFFSGKTSHALAYLTSYLAIMYVLLSGLTPMNMLAMFQASNMPVVVLAKFMQAKANFSNGHTGQLSAVTVFLLFLGSIARIFTTIQETGDTVMTSVYIVSTLANGVIASQVLWYWEATAEHMRRQKTKKKE